MILEYRSTSIERVFPYLFSGSPSVSCPRNKVTGLVSFFRGCPSSSMACTRVPKMPLQVSAIVLRADSVLAYGLLKSIVTPRIRIAHLHWIFVLFLVPIFWIIEIYATGRSVSRVFVQGNPAYMMRSSIFISFIWSQISDVKSVSTAPRPLVTSTIFRMYLSFLHFSKII